MTRTLSLFVFIVSILLTPPSFAGEREDTAWQKINDGALLIDVRTDGEWVAGHLDDAILIPYQQIVKQFKRLEIRKDRKIVVYCRSGHRAGIAENALRQAGYTNVFNGGGYSMLMTAKR